MIEFERKQISGGGWRCRWHFLRSLARRRSSKKPNNAARLAGRRFQSQQPQHVRFVFDQQVDDAAQPAHFGFDLREPRRKRTINAIEPQLHLLQIASDSRGFDQQAVLESVHSGLKSSHVIFRGHLVADSFHLAADEFNLAAQGGQFVFGRHLVAHRGHLITHCGHLVAHRLDGGSDEVQQFFVI